MKKNKDQTIKVSISRDHNARIENWKRVIIEIEPMARVTKQQLIELGINLIKESDIISLAKKNVDRKSLVLEYLKKDKNISDPNALISLLKKEIQSEK